MNSTLDAVMERPAASSYSAERKAKPVNFYCHAKPDAKSVSLAADFNDWDRTSLPMRRQPDGWWSVQVPLTHGHHQYVFLVDGEPELDPRAAGFVIGLTPFGKVSMMVVS